MKKKYRVCKNYEFSSIIQNKQYIASGSYICYFQKRKEEHARVGISVGKKLGNAVCRNKIKRQVRSMVDSCFAFDEEFDSIIIVRPKYKKQSYGDNEKELENNILRIKKKYSNQKENEEVSHGKFFKGKE